MSADSDRYSGICNNLNNITLLVIDNYPKTTTAAYDVLCSYIKWRHHAKYMRHLQQLH